MGQLLSSRRKAGCKRGAPLHLSSIPPHLLIEIASKTNTQTFPKLYRTCKGVKQVLDLGQKRIRIETPRVLEISVRKPNLQGAKLQIVYTIRPSWFGEKISTIIPAEDPIDNHFYFLGCFRLTKLSFLRFEERDSSLKGLLLEQLKRYRVQAEKLCVGDYGYSQAMMHVIKPNAIELTEALLKYDDEIPTESLKKLSGLTLRLEGLSQRGMSSAFQKLLPNCSHVDIFGQEGGQEAVFGELFCLIQKIHSDKCFTRSIKLIILEPKTFSVEPFLKQLWAHSLFVHHQDEYFFFCIGDKKNSAHVVVYLHWEPQLKIRIKACRTRNRSEMSSFVNFVIPLDRGNASFLKDLCQKYDL